MKMKDRLFHPVKYRYLRFLASQKGYKTTAGLADVIGMSTETLRTRLNDGTAKGASRWRLDEVYRVMDILHEPLENIQLVFPRDGRDSPEMALKIEKAAHDGINIAGGKTKKDSVSDIILTHRSGKVNV